MKLLRTVKSDMKHVVGDIKVVEWTASDPFPRLGRSVGVDTETELITDTVLDPPVVVLGCYDNESMTCYIVHWQDIPAFMTELCRRDVEQRYFNLGFDEQVIDNECDDKPLLTAIDQNRVRDMQIRIHLHEVATLGFIRGSLYNLKGCALQFLNYELDKGDGTENSARLSFRRDRQLTEEQEAYLPFDCISTWALGEEVPEAPRDPRLGISCELAHVKGMVVLAHISTNGFPVDMKVFKAFETKLLRDREIFKQQLLGFGFPDPDKDAKIINRQFKELFHDSYEKLMRYFGLQSGLPKYPEKPAKEEADDAEEDDGPKEPEMIVPKKGVLRLMLIYLYNYADDSSWAVMDEMASVVHTIAEGTERGLRKPEKQCYDEMCETYGIASVDASKKGIVLPAFVAKIMESYVSQLLSGDAGLHGLDFDKACEEANKAMDEHQEWFTQTEPIGPTKFFQQHVQKMIDNNPDLGDETKPGHLKKTEKSGAWKLTLKDMWRLKDKGISDKFLDAYTGFKHCTKMLSTYLNLDNIKADGKVHPHFTNVVRTGRVSSTRPNIQNLPSHDEVYPLKNIFSPPEGAILCATDFSFVELVAISESCIHRFGYSVMGDVINAGIDPHRWFAGVRKGIITSDTSVTKDPVKAAEMELFLKENITKQERQDSKAANRSWPFSR